MQMDSVNDAAFCHICRRALEEKKLKSTHKDPAFLINGFKNWMDGTIGFRKHENSDCHKEALQCMVVLPKTARDIREQLSQLHTQLSQLHTI